MINLEDRTPVDLAGLLEDSQIAQRHYECPYCNDAPILLPYPKLRLENPYAGDGYICPSGFLCSDIIERQQEIINEIKDFSKYNPEFALVMLGRITEMSYNARLELPLEVQTKA